MLPTMANDTPRPGVYRRGLQVRLLAAIAAAGGWIGFERYMELALYAPGLGYYARGHRQFGACRPRAATSSPRPSSGRCSAARWRARSRRRWKPPARRRGLGVRRRVGRAGGAVAGGAGRGASSAIRSWTFPARCARASSSALPRMGDQRAVGWTTLPEAMRGVVVGNEVLDAMPVKLLHCDGERWFERGVTPADGRLRLDRPTDRATAGRTSWPCRAPRPSCTPRPKPSSARWPACCGVARPSSSITVSPRPSTTTRSAWAAR